MATMMLRSVRLSYPHLAAPRVVQPGDDPKYGACFLIPKNHPDLPALLQLFATVKGDKWGANAPPTVKSVLSDGDTDIRYAQDPNTNGHMVLNTSSRADQKPALVDMNGNVTMDAGLFYPGCYVNAQIGVYAYDLTTSKGVGAAVNGVMFAADGERLDSRDSAEQMFAGITGAPPAIAPGIVGQPAPVVSAPVAPAVNPYAQPAPVAPAAPVAPVGAPATPAPVAPAPAGAPPAAMPGFLG